MSNCCRCQSKVVANDKSTFTIFSFDMGAKGLQVIDIIGLCKTFGHQSHFIFL